MRIAIVGGGAAGLTAAHLLDPVHDVVLFEAAPVLGGHIRTLGGNVPCPPGAVPGLDTGVIEFEAAHFPHVVRLFDALGVATEEVPATTTLFVRDGRRFCAPAAVSQVVLGAEARAAARLRLLPMLLARARFSRATALPEEELLARPCGDFLPETVFGTWLELLTMYAYSTPRAEVRAMPAGLVIPMLRRFLRTERWFRVVGGVSTWVQAVADRLRGAVHTAAPVDAIRREAGGVTVQVAGGRPEAFDVVVIATSPDRVLPMLADATPDERRRFGPWEGADIETLVHHDPGPYRRRGGMRPTEFDVFDLPAGDGGYNALLDRLCDVHADDGAPWGLAFHLDGELDPARIVHRQTHHVPRYTVAAFAHRAEVLATNGARRTFYVGAWLGDGLHEGAVSSGARVAAALGGRVL